MSDGPSDSGRSYETSRFRNPNLIIRYGILHPEKGVYLVGGEWSKQAKEPTPALTFTVDELADKLNTDEFRGCGEFEVHCDLPQNRASVEACANAGMGRWGERP